MNPNVPTMMKAVVIHEHGGIDKLVMEEIEVPVIGPNEVLVQIKAIALNHLDLWVRQGLPGLKLQMPHVPGSDAAGLVVKKSESVKGCEVGSRVLLAPGYSDCKKCLACVRGDDNLCKSYKILGHGRSGVYAEYVKVPADQVLPIPDGLNFEQAAAIPLVFLTSWNMLVHLAKVEQGEIVLVLGAGSGVGSAAIQIAKLFDAHVIATASTEDKLKLAAELGADDLINSEKEDFLSVVRKLTDGFGVNVVFEHVGKVTWERSLRALRTGGRLVTCGATTGYEAITDLRHVFSRGLQIYGNFMGRRAGLIEALRFFPNRLRPVVDACFPLSEAAIAHQRLMDRKQFGKVILKP